MVGQTPLIEKLRELARNLWWTWQPNVIGLFRELDPALWRKVDHNPVEFLKRIAAEQLERRGLGDGARLADRLRLPPACRVPQEHRLLGLGLRREPSVAAGRLLLGRVRAAREPADLLGRPGRSGGRPPQERQRPGHPADRRRPGLRAGVFPPDARRQRLAARTYLNADPELLPIEPVIGADGKPLRISIDTHAGVLHAQVWRVEVGRTTLLLLDSDVPENSESDRALDGPALRRRRPGPDPPGAACWASAASGSLHALGIHPSVLHLNEGHSAFAGLEMIRPEMETDGMPFGEASRNVAAMTVFTTHTPVAAGHDRFPASLVEEHLGKIREALHLSYDDFMGLGRVYPGRPERAVLHDGAGPEALAARQRRQRAARRRSRGGCGSRCIPNKTEEDVPIGHITNGVHVQSWVAPQMQLLFDRHLGTDWPNRQRNPETWEGIKTVEDAELWETQQVLKARLIDFVRSRLVAQAKRRGEEPTPPSQRATTALDLNALTIGFARRFATYKRAGLVLRDVERMAEMVNATDRPIQIIFAGKAHPEDHLGKELIQNIVRLTQQDRVLGTGWSSSRTTT